MKTLLIDYEQLAADASRALAKLVRQFQRAGAPVLKAESDGRTKRRASISYREAVLSFEDSQQITLGIKATGDIFEVKLNGKLTPIKAQDDHVAAVSELVARLDKGRAAHQKRLAAMKIKPPEGMKSAAPKQAEVLKAQIAEVNEQITAAEAELAALQA